MQTNSHWEIGWRSLSPATASGWISVLPSWQPTQLTCRYMCRHKQVHAQSPHTQTRSRPNQHGTARNTVRSSCHKIHDASVPQWPSADSWPNNANDTARNKQLPSPATDAEVYCCSSHAHLWLVHRDAVTRRKTRIRQRVTIEPQ